MEKNLENMFKEYGTVISTRILRKPDGLSRGVGFARMENKEKCDQIINAFNNKMLPGKHKQYHHGIYECSDKFKDCQ